MSGRSASLADLRRKQDEGPLIAPGVWDGLSARLVERAGFPAVCSSGYAVSASLGFPDIELYTATENLDAMRRIREATSLPIVADIDTGYGNAVNVIRTVEAAQRVGVAAVFMEDQMAPKRCPICVDDPVDLLPLEEAVGKIRAAASVKEPDFVLIARTDASGDEAIARMVAYREAGADLLMPVTKTFSSVDEWKAASEEVGGGLVATLTAGTWVERDFNTEVMRDIDVRLALMPTQLIHTVGKALEDRLASMGADEAPGAADGVEMPHADFIAMLGFQDAIDLQTQFMPQEVPQ